ERQLVAHTLDKRAAPRCVTAEDAYAPQRPDSMNGGDLRERLFARADDRELVGAIGSENPRRQPRSGARAQLPERERFDDREQRTGFAVIQNDERRGATRRVRPCLGADDAL